MKSDADTVSSGERRLAAIMFTDMVGYTALTQADESRAMAVLERHNGLVRSLIPRFRGREVKTIGDSFLVEFDSALDALRCAAEIQSQLHDHNQSVSDGERIQLRIGIHLGDVIHKDGDVFGDAVNISSRIQPLAEPEGVSISRQVYDQVRNKFDLQLVSLGEKDLKNVGVPTEVFSVVMPWESKQRQGDSPPESRRVAVLPFSNMSPDPADEFFADGMTEELISTVSRVEGAEVISRTSVMQYKKTPKPIKVISRELDAGTVLEGSIRKAGNRLRVTVQMIDAEKDRHVWAESYDRNLDDVFAIQSEIAGKVADALRTRVAKDTGGSVGGTENVDAYTDYLKAMHVQNEGTMAAAKSAIALLESAVAKDPGFVKAHAKLAEVWRHLGGYEDYTGKVEKARVEAEKAVSLGPRNAEAHAAMASVHVALDRFAEARKELETAARLNPNASETYRELGEITAAFGDLEASEAYFRKAYSLDPLSLHNFALLAVVLKTAGKVDEAIQVLTKEQDLYPRNAPLLCGLGECYMQKGDYGKARELLDRAAAIDPDAPECKVDLGVLFALEGKKKEAKEVLEGLKAVGRQFWLNGRVFIGAALGDYDDAYDALSEQARTHSWMFLVKSDPLLAGMRKDPRFPEFCAKVGLTP